MIYGELTPMLIVIRIIEGFAQIYLLSSILHKNIKKREHIISVAIIVPLFELFSRLIVLNFIVRLVMTVLIVVPVVSLVCKIDIYKVFLSYIITTVIIVLLDMVSGMVLLYVLDIEEFKEISASTGYYYLGMLLLNLFIFISAVSIKYFKMTFTNIDSDNRDLGIAFNILLTLLFIFPSLVLIVSYIENKPLSMGNIVITLISMLAIVILSIHNSQKRYNLIESEKNLEYEKSHNVILESLVDSLRTFKHDYNNTLATLYGYVQLDDMKSLKRMFKEILEESRQISSLDKLNPNLIKEPNVFGLITAKYQECVKKNVTMNFEIFTELEELEIRVFDLTRILGIFLDNAIEAASGSKERKLNILISEEREKIIIEITNTYSDKAISVEKIYEKGISSKGTNRGLGLYKVKEIIKKYPNVELKTVVDKDVFMQKLMIQKHI